MTRGSCQQQKNFIIFLHLVVMQQTIKETNHKTGWTSLVFFCAIPSHSSFSHLVSIPLFLFDCFTPTLLPFTVAARHPDSGWVGRRRNWAISDCEQWCKNDLMGKNETNKKIRKAPSHRERLKRGWSRRRSTEWCPMRYSESTLLYVWFVLSVPRTLLYSKDAQSKKTTIIKHLPTFASWEWLQFCCVIRLRLTFISVIRIFNWC